MPGMITNDDLGAMAPVRLSVDHYRALEAAYAKPPRAYHSWSHVLAVISGWSDVDVRLGWNRRREVFLALLYHDAIYVSGESDNEERSAAFARAQLEDIPAIDIGEVEHLIRMTASHGKLTSGTVDRDAGLFLDVDMAILGAPPAAYAAYAQGIRVEYTQVPLPLYRAGRGAFIERLLAAPRIFLSDDFHRRLDRQARINLRGELAVGMPA